MGRGGAAVAKAAREDSGWGSEEAGAQGSSEVQRAEMEARDEATAWEARRVELEALLAASVAA